MMEGELKVNYKIYVVTSNIPDAGTNSNVFIQLYGKMKSARNDSQLNCVKFPLEKSKFNRKKFQSGCTDIFEIEDVYVGSLKKIRISIDDSASTWHLKRIIICIDEFNKKYEFYCNKWLNGGNLAHDLLGVRLNKNQIEEKDLNDHSDQEADEKEREIKTKKSKLDTIPYDIKIKTSEYSKLAESTKIDLKIKGKFGESNKIKLNDFPSDNEKEKFLSNNLDIFKIDSPDVGNIEKIKFYVANDTEGKPSDWFFDDIIINQPSKLLRYFFDKKSRIIVQKEQDRNLIEVFPIRVEKIVELKICNIYLYTTKLINKIDIKKHTKLSVFAEFGNAIDLKPITPKHVDKLKLIKPMRTLNPNEDILHFHFAKKDMGEIYKIKLVHSYPGQKSNWLLKRVEVYYDKKIITLPANKLLNTEKDNKKCEVKLYVENRNFTRTISTLSHTRIEDTINDENPNNDSYENDFSDDDDDDNHNLKSKKSTKSSRSRSLSSKESLRSYEKEFDRSKKNKHHSKEDKYDYDYDDDLSINKKKTNSKSKLHLNLDYMSDEEYDHRKRNLKHLEEKPFKKHNYDDDNVNESSRRHNRNSNKLDIDDEINRRINDLLSREKPITNRKFEFKERNDYDVSYKEKKHSYPDQFRDVEMIKNNSASSSSYNQPRIRVK